MFVSRKMSHNPHSMEQGDKFCRYRAFLTGSILLLNSQLGIDERRRKLAVRIHDCTPLLPDERGLVARRRPTTNVPRQDSEYRI